MGVKLVLSHQGKNIPKTLKFTALKKIFGPKSEEVTGN
jgi:hypothetical protein